MNDFLIEEIIQITVKNLAILISTELQDNNRLWLKLITEEHTVLLSEVFFLYNQIFREVYSLKDINYLTSFNSSLNIIFNSYNILKYTQAIFSEKKWKNLQKITLDIIK